MENIKHEYEKAKVEYRGNFSVPGIICKGVKKISF